jgi:hypothetical protein
VAIGPEDIEFSHMREPLVGADGHGGELVDREDAPPGIDADIMGQFALKDWRPDITAVYRIREGI